MENKFQKLNNIIELSTSYKKWLHFFHNVNSFEPQKDIPIMMRSGTGAIWYDHEMLGMKSFFIDNNISLAKQHFYTCGMLDEYRIKMYDADILDWGIIHFTYMLLSDCKELIDRYAMLKHRSFEKNVNSGNSTISFCIQMALKNDLNELERVIEIMKTKSVKKHATMQWDVQFFEGFLEKNKQKMEAALNGLITPKVHKIRNKHEILLNEFISHPALGYAKLAWLKGIEVEVNSTLVPKELLPVKPLDNYVNEYAFLDEVELPKKL